MARTKIPDDETIDSRVDRLLLEAVSNHATRSEKTSWNRKHGNMEKLINKLRPLEEQILEIKSLQIPIHDEVAVLRNEMVNTCIHPIDLLVVKDDNVICKFCNKVLQVVDEQS